MSIKVRAKSAPSKVQATTIETIAVISAAEAISMGWSPSDLRGIANSLERIAKDKTNGAMEIEYTKNRSGHTAKTTVGDLTNYNARINFQRAREFRTLAKMVEMVE